MCTFTLILNITCSVPVLLAHTFFSSDYLTLDNGLVYSSLEKLRKHSQIDMGQLGVTLGLVAPSCAAS